MVGVGGTPGGGFLGASEFGDCDLAAAGSVAAGPDHMSHSIVWPLLRDQVVLGSGVERSRVSAGWSRGGSTPAVDAFASGIGFLIEPEVDLDVYLYTPG